VQNSFLRATGLISFVIIVLAASQAFPQSPGRIETRDQIIELLLKENPTIQECIDRSGGPEKTFKIKPLDLNKDKSREIMLQGIAPCVCGPRRCLNRIYRQDANLLDLLLKADFAQEIEPQKVYSNGYRNLWAAVYMYHSFTSVLYEYQYDGKQYRWDHCLMRFFYYSETVNGKPFSGRVRYHTDQSISWVGCNPNDPFGP